MALLTPITTPLTQSTCPKPCAWAEHDGAKVLRAGVGTIVTFRHLIVADTEAERAAAITAAHLTPLPLSKRQQAAALFRSWSVDLQARFQAVFQALSATDTNGRYVIPDSALLPAIQAVTVPDADAANKAALVALLS